jgi:hypothetical protein
MGFYLWQSYCNKTQHTKIRMTGLCGLVARAADPEVWVRFPSLSDFLRTGSTQPREYN